MVNFESLNLPEPVLRALADMGFTEASPIQVAAVPVALRGTDLIGQAQTGTGKTAAFGIALVCAALQGRPAIVLTPTRELAQQVAAEIDRIGKHAEVKALALYGGAPFGEQARAIASGTADVLVATPGRLRDHIERGTIEPSAAKMLVLDEADEMLKMGFIDEVESILESIGRDRQTLLFSATMPEPVVRLAERYMKEPEMVVAVSTNDSIANAGTEQFAVMVEHREKLDALVRILAAESPTGALVFRHTRESVDELVQQLRAKDISAEALHGGMAQDRREDVLRRMRTGRCLVLVATNVAARGLDVDVISHVFNYDAPRETEAYVHRIGRTGRAGREGRSYLFATPGDRQRVRGIERAIGHRLRWADVPTDEQVHTAVRERAIAWMRERSASPPVDARATIDAAVTAGIDIRELAAALFAAAAPHEGLVAPKLEPRRVHSAPRAETRAPRRERSGNEPLVAVTLAVGRDDGVRPADIVGALTHEGGLVGADIGRIDILPRMSVAEIPGDRVDEVFAAMERATIRGRAPNMRVANRWEFRAPVRRA